MSDPRTNATTMTYDARGNLLTRTAPAPLSYVETFTYSTTNDLLTARDRRGNTTTNTYDAAGNLTRTAAPDGTFSTSTHNPQGLVLTSTDPRGKTTTYGYDAQANVNRVVSPLGEVTTMTYDGAGRMRTMVDPRGNVTGAIPTDYTTTFAYDNAGNLLTMTDPLGNVTTSTYDPAGNRTSTKDANNRTTTDSYDAANHLKTVTDAAGGVTTYVYDATRNITSRVDAKGHATTYAYDLSGRQTSTTDPAAHAWSLTYDAAGNVATRRDANAKTTTFAYDAINRLTAITYAASTTAPVTYTYDGNDNRTAMTDGAGSETYLYDALDRLTRVTRGPDVFSYAYDAGGNLTSRTYPDATVTAYAYDDDGRLASTASGGTTTANTYDPAGDPLTTSTPDGFTARSAYDRAGRLLEIAHTGSAGTLSRFTYTLDPVGNRTQMTTTRGTMVYTYDVLDRLTRVCYAGCPGNAPLAAPAPCGTCIGTAAITRPPEDNPPPPSDTSTSWTYDQVGNRLTEANYLGAKSYAYDAADRLTGVTGVSPMSYTYDANGNELTAGSTGYAYDLADRLVSASVGTTTETYTWSGDGIRTSAATGSQAAKTVRFLVDRAFALPTAVIERDGANKTLRRYSYGLDLLSQTTPTKGPYWYHHDGLGSVTDITGSTGTSVAWTEYSPFGAPRASAATSQAPLNPFRFSGQYLDSTSGLYHLRARQYDPTSGRFTAVDPQPGGMAEPYVNAYAYANGNPMRYVDPSRRCFGPLIFLAPVCIGAAIGVVSYVASTVASNVVGNAESRKPLDEDVLRGVNAGDAIISGGVGALTGPLGGITYAPTRILATAAYGCAATFASQAVGGRTGSTEETGVGCVFGAVAGVPKIASPLLSALYGLLVATGQGIANLRSGGK